MFTGDTRFVCFTCFMMVLSCCICDVDVFVLVSFYWCLGLFLCGVCFGLGVYLLLLYVGVGCTVWFACSWLFVVWLVCVLVWLLL